MPAFKSEALILQLFISKAVLLGALEDALADALGDALVDAQVDALVCARGGALVDVLVDALVDVPEDALLSISSTHAQQDSVPDQPPYRQTNISDTGHSPCRRPP